MISIRRTGSKNRCVLINFSINCHMFEFLTKDPDWLMFWDRYSTFCTILTNLYEFFYVDPNDRTTFFYILMFKLQINHIKLICITLTISFFENSENFLKNGIYCASMKNAPLRSYKALKKGKNCKKCYIHQFWPSATQKLWLEKIWKNSG